MGKCFFFFFNMSKAYVQLSVLKQIGWKEEEEGGGRKGEEGKKGGSKIMEGRKNEEQKSDQLL